MSNKYSVKLVSSRTGLSPQLIRTWEKRYQAITPERTPTGRRLYSESDLEKLMLLKRATQMGMAISNIASLSIEELYELVDKRSLSNINNDTLPADDSASYHLDQCMTSIIKSDYEGLESSLLNASTSLGQQVVVEKVIHPLLTQIGEMWHKGEIKIAQEHMASSIIRSMLGSMLISGKIASNGPTLLVTTPPGQLHEFGALISAVTAVSLGWRVIYLGPSLPVEEIADSVLKHKADALALSITIVDKKSNFEIDLRRLKKIIGNEYRVLVGGQGAGYYQQTVTEINAKLVDDLDDLKKKLSDLRPTGNPV